MTTTTTVDAVAELRSGTVVTFADNRRTRPANTQASALLQDPCGLN
jgi:hypothetical protein